MTETAPEAKAARKSDFTGETFGAWTVVGKGEQLERGKRFWLVRDVNGVEKTVLQTELKALAKTGPAPVPAAAPEPAAGDPFSVPVDQLDAMFGEALPGVGPGQCKHDVFVNDCPECGALLGDKLDGPNPHRHPSPDCRTVGKLRSEDDPFELPEHEDDDLAEPAVAGFDLAEFATAAPVTIVFSADQAPAAPLLVGDQVDPLRRAIKDLYEAVETAKLAVQGCQAAADIVLKYVIKAG